MAAKGDAHRTYEVHGDGVDTIYGGFVAIGMPEQRRAQALALIREVTEINSVRQFRWYKTPGKDELCCWWDAHEVNVLWIWKSHVHARPDSVEMPRRPTNWVGHDGHAGWLLPGADPGSDSDRRRPSSPATFTCPVTFIAHPAGTECPDCEIVHTRGH